MIREEEAPTTEFFPWPPRESVSALDAFARTWRDATFHSTAFFRNLPRRDELRPVLFYYLPLAVVVAGLNLFWDSVLDVSALTQRLVPGSDPSSNGVVDFLLSPLIALVVLFAVSAVVHLMLLITRGARHGFTTTTRVLAFAYSPALFAAVPVAGSVVGFVWMIVVAISGLREAHETTSAKAAAAVIVPAVLLVIVIAIAMLAAITMGLLNTRL